MRDGRVGSDVWDKVPNKYVFFDTFHVMQYDYFFRTYNVHAMSFTPEEIFEEVGWIGKD